MKTVLFIPGFQENLKDRDYKAVIQAIEGYGYKVKFLSVNWRYTVLSDWVTEVEKEYARYPAEEVILAGFSFGAITALAVASHLNPAGLWLFSLSPYFSDDIHLLPTSWLAYVGKRRVKSFQKLDFKSLAQNITCPVIVLYGEEESSGIKSRAEAVKSMIKGSRVVEVKKAGHEVDNKEYIDAIQKTLKNNSKFNP